MVTAPRDRKVEPAGNVEQNVYADVYWVLMGGMVASTALFALSIILALVHPQYVPMKRSWILSQYQWSSVRHGLWAGNPASLMLVATVLLILTPVARVLISIYAFAVDRDFKYVAVTAIVFLVMVLTVLLSLLGLK